MVKSGVGGGVALPRHRGYRYPGWAVRSPLDPAFPPAELPEARDVTARHLGPELIHLGTVDAWATVRARAAPKINAAASRIPWRSG